MRHLLTDLLCLDDGCTNFINTVFSKGRALTQSPDAGGTNEMHAHNRNLHVLMVRLSEVTQR